MIHKEFVSFDFFSFMHLCSICLTILDPTEVISKFSHVHLNKAWLIFISVSGLNTVKSCITCLMIWLIVLFALNQYWLSWKKSNVKFAKQCFTWKVPTSALMIVSMWNTMLIPGIVACAFLKYFLWIKLKIYFVWTKWDWYWWIYYKTTLWSFIQSLLVEW